MIFAQFVARGLDCAQFLGIGAAHSKTSYWKATPSGVIFLEQCFRGVGAREHLEMLGVTDLLARVDVDEDCHCWSLLSFRRPQCISLRSVNIRSTLRFKARSTPMR